MKVCTAIQQVAVVSRKSGLKGTVTILVKGAKWKWARIWQRSLNEIELWNSALLGKHPFQRRDLGCFVVLLESPHNVEIHRRLELRESGQNEQDQPDDSRLGMEGSSQPKTSFTLSWMNDLSESWLEIIIKTEQDKEDRSITPKMDFSKLFRR